MNALQTATLMRIFVDDAERYEKHSLHMAIVHELLTLGFGGVTVLKGIEGFGSNRHLHALRAIDTAPNLPVLIEVAETEDKVRSVIPRLREMIPEGLITLERIQMRQLSKLNS